MVLSLLLTRILWLPTQANFVDFYQDLLKDLFAKHFIVEFVAFFLRYCKNQIHLFHQ